MDREASSGVSLADWDESNEDTGMEVDGVGEDSD